jgi:hypothetical protein
MLIDSGQRRGTEVVGIRPTVDEHSGAWIFVVVLFQRRVVDEK